MATTLPQQPEEASKPMIDSASLILLFGAGLLAGLVNAVAGGGTFFTFPALVSVGLPPVIANATSALAVWPGHAAAVPAAWASLSPARAGLPLRCGVALAGGLAGSALLLATDDRLFTALVPWLLFVATALFAAGPRLRRWVPALASGPGGRAAPAALAVELAVAVYGGYFGAGLGVLLMATLALVGHDDVREAAALKNLLASVVTSIAVVLFVVAGAISWPHALPALAGAVLGGVLGARLAQRLPAIWLRRAVVAVGAALTVVFMVRAYG